MWEFALSLLFASVAKPTQLQRNLILTFIVAELLSQDEVSSEIP